MTEMLERITSEMSEEEVLGVILDEIMARAEPDVAEAIRFCAIPHCFNEEIIAWLRGEGLNPSQCSREILAALTELTFVGPYHERGWAYHENVRDLLLRRWREGDDEEFKELSGRAAGYFAHKLGGKKEETLLARLFAAVRRVLGKVEMLTEDERGEYERELMYHLLVADPAQGFRLFWRMFNRARDFYQLSKCSLLLQLAGEQEAHLSTEDRLRLRFCQGQLAHVSAQWPEALEIFEDLWGEDLPPSLEGTLANDLGALYKVRGELERAIEYLERSLAIAEKTGDERGVSTVLENLGVVYQDKGEWDNAIEHHKRSLAIKEKVGDEQGMAATFNNLGEVYRVRGEWQRAVEYYERSLAITQKIGHEYGIAVAFGNLGLVHQIKGEWERATRYYERSLAIYEELGDEHGKGIVLWNRATTYYQIDIAEKALVDIEQAVTIFENFGGIHLELARDGLEEIRAKVEGRYSRNTFARKKRAKLAWRKFAPRQKAGRQILWSSAPAPSNSTSPATAR